MAGQSAETRIPCRELRKRLGSRHIAKHVKVEAEQLLSIQRPVGEPLREKEAGNDKSILLRKAKARKNFAER
jgi:hypothetical protein